MANQFIGVISVTGTNGQKTQTRYDLGTFDLGTAGANYEAAKTAVADIVTKTAAISDGEVAGWVTDPAIVPTTLPAAADVYEEAVVSVYLSAPGEAQKLSTIRVPAPAVAIFEGTTGEERDIVDKANAGLIALVASLSTNVYLSDGEQINTGTTNGIKAGYRRTKPVKR